MLLVMGRLCLRDILQTLHEYSRLGKATKSLFSVRMPTVHPRDVQQKGGVGREVGVGWGGVGLGLGMSNAEVEEELVGKWKEVEEGESR
ncbi:unnamed protein product [Hydatigera taeniaeformis]|uniref:Uncharacterized protein n=1 Tax=Hydatigena taeniaeformis TaxID=6205 RepID=A0A0R3XBB9_HYDTA|nr:unnamed protein product [Hydatigera taeniaeformis]